jgi:hypothetical protein
MIDVAEFHFYRFCHEKITDTVRHACRNPSMLMNDADSGNDTPGCPLHSGFMFKL